jgi:hypothetical protein
MPYSFAFYPGQTLSLHRGHGTPCPCASRLPTRRGTACRALLQIAEAQKDVQLAKQPMGEGRATASAAVATIGDCKQFTSGAQFGARTGLEPRQHSVC